ncbi:Asp/Glu racemase [Acidihalobacter ferrooxydans]|uniref:Asp/Glu racemase n=1 Tax=Acidihalobacter ferrooxydans TaxID=1765967 RepID=A0A1P8ULJ7_9GAMM|nr:Asp/Glu racemase [Acidihalobacter ferrooxydans]
MINPNSNQAVTASMSESVECLRASGGPMLDCVTLAEGPLGIESLAHVMKVEPLLRNYVLQDKDADAFVLGCYSDPGIHICREATDKPVFGIQEISALLAISRGGRFGVISLSPAAVERHLRYLRSLGLESHCAGDRAANMSVAESRSGEGTLAILVEVAQRLVNEDGAHSIILGCTGMARHRASLQDAIGIPVIEPTQAATSMAIGALGLGW